MIFLVKVGYIIGSVTVGVYLYYWSSFFKRLGMTSMEELNEEEEIQEDLVDERETSIINYFGSASFLLMGILIWIFMGITVGKIASETSDIKIIRWVGYVLLYFLFLRFPFGIGNRMVKKSYNFETLPEKIPFVIVMILAYIISICCFEALPGFLKWHLSLLE